MVYMAASKKVIELAEIAASAIADKLGTDIVCIDMTDQMVDRKSTRLNSSHSQQSRMPSSA